MSCSVCHAGILLQPAEKLIHPSRIYTLVIIKGNFAKNNKHFFKMVKFFTILLLISPSCFILHTVVELTHCDQHLIAVLACYCSDLAEISASVVVTFAFIHIYNLARGSFNQEFTIKQMHFMISYGSENASRPEEGWISQQLLYSQPQNRWQLGVLS